MSVFKCRMCGGDLAIEQGSAVAQCEYCGSRQTVPSADSEKKITLFGRAGRLLRSCEFDKAAGVYEALVADFPEEAEAYWGLVLCRYGIEYVDDPATGKKIPTCHRSGFDSVMEDKDFEQACENADPAAKKLYREEAKRIEELRKNIIEVSSNEEPYDIFICYKETAEDGQRTIDSVLAQDICEKLTDAGYRVFFSRISLEDKLGQEYEPYIFAALNSAKVMLVFGTDYEYFNAVWVKNEWSRYLKLMEKDKTKRLIPCYKDIDAYDMPKEFVKLQSQDMGKVGADQDLIRAIKKLLPREKAETKTTVIASVGSISDLDALISIAETNLKLNKFKDAFKNYQTITDRYPGDYRGWWGMIVADTQNLCYPSQNQENVDAWYEYLGKLTPADMLEPISNKYKNYLKCVAEADANADIYAVRGKAEECNNMIALLQNQNNEICSRRSLELKNKESELKVAYTKLNECTERLDANKKEYERATSTQPYMIVGGAFALIIWLVLFINQIKDPSAASFVNFLAYLVLIALLLIPGYLLIGRLFVINGLKKDVENAESSIEIENARISAIETKYKARFEQIDSASDDVRAKIESVNKKLLKLNDYINNSKKTLEAYHYSIRCGKIGADVPFSGNVLLPEQLFEQLNLNIDRPKIGQ